MEVRVAVDMEHLTHYALVETVPLVVSGQPGLHGLHVTVAAHHQELDLVVDLAAKEFLNNLHHAMVEIVLVCIFLKILDLIFYFLSDRI